MTLEPGTIIDGKYRIDQDHQGDRRNHGGCRIGGKAFGIWLDAQAEVTRDPGDDETEDQPLGKADDEVGHRHGALQVVDKIGQRDIELQHG